MNKKIIVTLLSLVTCIIIVNGQINKGAVLVGGQLYYQKTTIDNPNNEYDQKSNGGTFNVAAGVAIKENSILGINVAYMPGATDNFYNGSFFADSKTRSYSTGVFYRQYKKLAKDFYFFAEAGAAYTRLHQEISDAENVKVEDVKQHGGQLNLTPGVAYKIFNKMYLEVLIPNIVSVQYLVTKDAYQSTLYKQKQFYFNSSLNATSLSSLGVGFRFVL